MGQVTVSIILSAFAVYRLAYLIAYEDGPFDLASKWRELVGQKNWIGRGFHCALCISFWVSILPALYLSSSVVQFILYWQAIAGLVLLLHKVIKHL